MPALDVGALDEDAGDEDVGGALDVGVEDSVGETVGAGLDVSVAATVDGVGVDDTVEGAVEAGACDVTCTAVDGAIVGAIAGATICLISAVYPASWSSMVSISSIVRSPSSIRCSNSWTRAQTSSSRLCSSAVSGRSSVMNSCSASAYVMQLTQS